MSAPDFLDHRLAKAWSHPLRQKILEILTLRGESSPVQLADELGERLPNVSYHVRMLHDLGCIELLRTEPRRGALEHFYRSTVTPFLDDSQWERLPLSVRRQLAGQTAGRIVRSVSGAAQNAAFDRPGAHVDWVPLALDAQGWSELSEFLSGILARAAEIQAASDERRGADREVVASELAVLHYEAPGD
jgi:hypothetical protein